MSDGLLKQAWGLTVKLDKVVPRILPDVPPMRHLFQESFLLSLSLVELEDNHETSRDKRQDDRECSVRPPPVGLVKVFRELGSCVRSDDPW